MKKTTVIITIFILIFSISLNAQDTSQVSKTYKHKLGLAAGFSTGYGLSYKFTPNNFGIQTTIGTFYNDFSFGITPFFIVKKSQIADVFLYNGNHFYDYEQASNSQKITNSFGIGFEINSDTPFTFCVMGGIASKYYLNGDWNYDYTIEAAIYYKL